MTYEEAKQTALDAMTDYPDQIKVTNYSGDGEEFTAIAYSKLNAEEKRIKANGGFRWDMIINSTTIEYRQYYEDIRMKLVKAAPKEVSTPPIPDTSKSGMASLICWMNLKATGFTAFPE